MPSKTTATAAGRVPRQAGPTGRAAHWRSALCRTPVSIWKDDLSDWAAALTYYAILALLPALLVTVALIGLANPRATDTLITDITAFAPAESGAALRQPLEAATHERGAVWLLIATGTVSAVWSASSYLAVFRRALHAQHGVRDRRPALRKAHIIVATAVGLLLLLMTSAFALVLTGPLARWLGHRLGLAHASETLWAVLKWPVLVFLVACLIMVLFRTGPASARGLRRGLPGGVLAAFLWLVASAGFALYATHIGSYSRLYGSLAGLVVFLIWVWFTNLALLAGAQFNVELARPTPGRS
ncbi:MULTISPECIES: YihY/virulence factor BrkB family protein [unclassified Streptomyces]|uniref:YihY/virulence factor BrkB family protein n=1 Tax=unclassified Streptomyces TaxID=2593676 RepID=UPI002DDA8ED9|nr:MULTISPECIES: YihY/virulence factor BrkB family protein [unclassified Streptomyces]WSF89150.1 YihY/virulence factor BrkB family protein [Streptomyces sp. NBC_01744]WSC34681.1 YihY/virulence factor BrkB family protein [Streptomyces sp. NBC_01763]WSC43089.1 YihY/virulence factor BrkB family protein [Streptomyces sp. NBC_01762]WSC58050.1 YihY/virulence factor BrkB family protein [Streptomyces sp. NBC_01761]WSD22626.1 YihY/virulence factor BrkB family protein [Streptomyces sp. NBC_01751]